MGSQDGEPYSVFVGDLAPEVSDFVLMEAFRGFYASVTSAKVITDPSTGRSKGYGFVRFSSEPERDRALEMQGYNLGGRPIRVSLATARRNGGGGSGGASAAPHPAELDPTNTTLFIGGLSAGVSEEQLRAVFGQYGDIVYTKIPAGKGCGFVQFVERPAAEMAMASLNGQVMGANAIRISWGRSTSRAPSSARAAAAAGFAAPGGAAGVAAALGGGGYGGMPMGGALGALGYPIGGAGFGAGAFINGAPMLGQAPAGYGLQAYGLSSAGQMGAAAGGMVPGLMPQNAFLSQQQQQQQMLLASAAAPGGGAGAGGVPMGGYALAGPGGAGGAPGGAGGAANGLAQYDPSAADKIAAFGGAPPQQLLRGGGYMLAPN